MASREKQPSLASLLGAGDGAALWQESDLAAIVRHQLRTPVDRSEGRTFEEVLLDQAANVESLRRIKELAKGWRDDPGSGIPGEVCHVIYYAAIAAARVRGEASLTTLDGASLARGLRWAVEVEWTPQPLKTLLRTAIGTCSG